MRPVLFFILALLSSCYTSRSVKHFAKEKGLSVKEYGEIDLFAGSLETKSRSGSQKSGPFYLLYRGDSLIYLSADKGVKNGDFIYRVQRWGDTVYMLTRSSLLRYFCEDTVVFHVNYAVSNRCFYSGNAANKGKLLKSHFNSYHLAGDTVMQLTFSSSSQSISIHQYGTDLEATEQFIATQSQMIKIPGQSKTELIKYILR